MNVIFAACANLIFEAAHNPLNFGSMASLQKSRTHLHKGTLAAKASTTQEPDARKPHVRVCAGGAR